MLATGFEIGKILRPRHGQFSWLRYRPFMGFEYEHASQSDYTERSNNMLALSYDDSHYDRTQFCTGASALISTKRCDFDAKLMYTCLLGGNASPASNASFASIPNSVLMAPTSVITR